MKLKKMLAAVAACAMMTGMNGNINAYPYADEDDCVLDDGVAKLYASECYYYQWPDDDGGFSMLSGEVLSESNKYVILPKYGDKTVKIISHLFCMLTEYLTIPEGCEILLNDAFGSCIDLKAVSIPDSVSNIERLNPEIAIVGNKDTYAEFFAKKNGNEFILTGDTDQDGKIGAGDIVGQMLYLTGEQDYETDIAKLAADMNSDGKVNIIDLIQMKKSSLGGGKNSFKSEDILAVPVFKSERVKPEADVIKGYLDFTADFSDNVLLKSEDKKQGSNRIYSPLSVYMAVSVLTECCDGQSLEELSDFLSVSDKDALQKINQNIFDSLYYNDFDRYCRMTNSIWLDRQYTFKRNKLETLAEKYYTSSFTRDLKSQTDCDEISEWIYQNTSGKFKPLIMADPDTDHILKIVNTVTFKEKWTSSFGDPKEGTFKTADGEVQCPFMFDEEIGGSIIEDEDFVEYTKSFEDGYCMHFVLPAEEKTVDDVLSDADVMKRVFSDENTEYYRVLANIPKFSSESKFDLIQSFKDAGVKEIFESADLSPLMDFDENDIPGAYVDEITHEAVIDVNEKGCEAAAYTLIDIAPNCPITDNMTYYFDADRPFIYYISNNDGVPVFVGVVNDPTQK